MVKLSIVLGGGLGNQLFQYAYGRALSIRSNAAMELDAATLFARDQRYRRSFELDAFNLPEDIVIKRKPDGWIEKRWDAVLRQTIVMQPLHRRKLINETEKGKYDPAYARLKMSVSSKVQGYWHCPKYFQDAEQAIRRDLVVKMSLPFAYQKLAMTIQDQASVGVHVRRKDFWSTLSILYYRLAMTQLQALYPGLHFYIFTDDPDWWVENAVQQENVTLVCNPAASGIDDFHLLSYCRHFIIANSSFSWWAAWLGQHPAKTVIAPSKEIWFNSWAVLPDDWRIIPVTKDVASRSPQARAFTFIPKLSTS